MDFFLPFSIYLKELIYLSLYLSVIPSSLFPPILVSFHHILHEKKLIFGRSTLESECIQILCSTSLINLRAII